MSIYIQLLHGRKDPDEDMNEYGFDGPCIGPFDWMHVIYNIDFQLTREGPPYVEWWVSFVGDLLYYDGAYYGDWEIVDESSMRNKTITPYDESKATLAHASALAALKTGDVPSVSKGGEQPRFSLNDWKWEVLSNETRRSYSQWVVGKLSHSPNK